MPPAIIAGGIAAAGTIGGALLSSHSQTQAANQAEQSQQAATAAQLQLGQQSLALNQGIYNSNYNLLSPFVSRGNVAGHSINALLGLPAAPTMTSPMATQGGTTGGANGGVPGGVPAASGYGGPSLTQIMAGAGGQPAMDSYMAYYQAHPEQDPGFTNISQFHGDPYRDEAAAQSVLAGHQAYSSSHPTTPTTPTSGGTPATAPAHSAAGGAAATNALSPSSALNNFANSAGMKFQLAQGADMINNQYAARGALQSGAAMKAIQDYGQQTALNNYFMPYMNLLGGQQAVGAQAGSAVAGVGSSFGNTAAGINANMGQAIGNGADAASNAALLRGQANANMWNGIGSGLGGLASSFMPTGGLGQSLYPVRNGVDPLAPLPY